MTRGLFDLTGRVVLATGANSGIGLGFLQGCAKQGADVGRLAPLAAKFSAGGQPAQILAGDIGDSAYPARLIDALAAIN